MLSKNDILDALLFECDVAKHLGSKIPEGGLDYRMSESQRTTLELMRYMSFCGTGGTSFLATGEWDGYREVAERAAEMTAEEFPAAMDRQKDELRALVASISDEDFASKEVSDPMGNKDTLGRMMITMPLRWMAGYRMQLFLQAKAAGNDDIWTPDCWMGMSVDKPTPA